MSSRKIKVSKKVMLLTLSGLVTAVGLGISIPFIIQSTHTNNANSTIPNVSKPSGSSLAPINYSYDNFVNNYDGTLTSNSLVFSASGSKEVKSSLQTRAITVDGLNDIDSSMGLVDAMSQGLLDNSYDPKYNEVREVIDMDGAHRKIVTTKCFDNNRKYMPILTYNNDTYYSYSESRTWDDVNRSIYPGWNLNRSNLSSHNQNKMIGVDILVYTPTEVLKTAYPSVTDKIIGLSISLSNLISTYGDQTKQVLSQLIDAVNPSLVNFWGVSDSNLDKLPDLSSNTNIKKISIRGDYSNLNGFVFPSSVLELEFSSQNYKAVDPLQIPESAAIIYEQGYSSYFTSIDLSTHKGMSNEDLQKAVNVVYQQRIHERAFQGDFAGGYIYSWNLRNTGIYSFNNVTIPMLTDGTGRFYIAYVAVETDGNQGPIANEVISDNSSKPSNDSQINEWFDWNQNGWSTITEVKITAKDNVKLNFNNTVQEILGFINKYPNIKVVDISALQFSNDETLDELIDAVNKAIADKYTGMDGTPTVKLDFIKVNYL
ncbi:IgG-blocking protein M [Mycoplasmoides alvi]|uniref:IgG-blocking protein M n=1 Tax=Mycoplasmoides alvi TaxID=78580 RepID=UPI00051AD033|nr:IgG-blocking protein M [Mycoplasmoides alvi]